MQLYVIQTFGDQKYAVSSGDTRFGNLVTVNDEFFAHHGNANDLADVTQIIEMSLKKMFVGQNTQASGPGNFILAGDRDRVEVRPDQTR